MLLHILIVYASSCKSFIIIIIITFIIEKNINMHHFSVSKKSASIAGVVTATEALVPKIVHSLASEGPTPELDRDCFDLPSCPQPTAVHFRDREGP